MDELIDEYSGFNNIRRGPCQNGYHVNCAYSDIKNKYKCRVSIRMQVAFTLAGALLIKALYMISTILLARRRFKTKCLTFGDVIVAATFNPELQVRNECLVNAGEAYRSLNNHSCHKHCHADAVSMTGDDLGHCQICNKYNTTNRSAQLEHPIVATKYKKSLISNLGFTAVFQMLLLMFCSLVMLGISIVLSVILGQYRDWRNKSCMRGFVKDHEDYTAKQCQTYAKNAWQTASGKWGGFNASRLLASLPHDKLLSETTAFTIANAAQLLYSLLYLLLIYNITLISAEFDWGSFEFSKKRLRCTLVKGSRFDQSYLLQLPAWVIFPLMVLSALMHWLLSQSISTLETVRWSHGDEKLGMNGIKIQEYHVRD